MQRGQTQNLDLIRSVSGSESPRQSPNSSFSHPGSRPPDKRTETESSRESTKDKRAISRNQSAEWALSSGEEFDFEADFEIREENDIEEGLEAVPSFGQPACIEEEIFVESEKSADSISAGIVRVPLAKENLSKSSSAGQNGAFSVTAVTSSEIPRFFPTTATFVQPPPSNELSGFVESRGEDELGLRSRSKRVPTLPSLPVRRPKEPTKNSLFGDLFGKKTESIESSTTSTTESAVPDRLDKMKTKISSALNNVKYGWTIKSKTNFKTNAALWLLGELYHPAMDVVAGSLGKVPTEEEEKAAAAKVLDMFKSDFTSRIWFTYRKEFPVLSGSNLTSDCGWGCMLRSAQMMLAQCFVVHFLGRDWRLFHYQDRTQETFHRQIIQWFGDYPSDLSPFSVHRLVKVGQTLGKKAGDWYGPSSVAYIAREAMQGAYTFNPLLNQIRIYVAKDCTIYVPDVNDLCTEKPRQSFSSSVESASEDKSILPYHLKARALSEKVKAARNASRVAEDDEWKTALLLLIPVRLGGESLNEAAYMDCLKSMLAMKQSCGIIGGRPKHSLYFVGYQEDRLIHLDPHFCQDVVDVGQRDFPLHTFHCVSPRKMLFSKMDPSCTFGFYLRNRAEFEKFIGYVNEVLVSQPKGSYPMFVFSPERMEDVETVALEGLDLENEFVVDPISGKRTNSKLSPDSSDDDYVLL